MDEHILEAVGRTRVVVRDGKVVEVGTPVIRECSLARRFACPVHEITPEAVRKNIENRISSFGMCTPDREIFSHDDFVGFGASELTSSGLSGGIIDAAVLACDGAGTVIVTSPAMAQGIGGRMSGLVKTSPLVEVIDRIRSAGGIVVDPVTASIDPVFGVSCAHNAGYTRILVTAATAEACRRIRASDPEALIIAVHVTGMDREDAESVAVTADIVTSCASAPVREVCGKKAIIQAGTSVPVFVMSQRGKELLVARIAAISHQLLITHTSLPVCGESSPRPLI